MVMPIGSTHVSQGAEVHGRWLISGLGRSCRKDRAMGFTRELVLDHIPRPLAAEHYQGLEVIIFLSQSQKLRSRTPNAEISARSALRTFMLRVAKETNSPTPLHLIDHLERYCTSHFPLWRHEEFNSAAITYEVVNYDPLDLLPCTHGLRDFYILRGVVRFSAACEYTTQRAQHLGDAIYLCIHSTSPPALPIGTESIPRSGRLYLCNASPVILSPEEFVAAGDRANEVAKLKVFEAMSRSTLNYTWYGTSISWALYSSRIHFVDSGFRPTLADMTAD
jgi:hypothetical protein